MKATPFNSYNQQVPAARNFYSTASSSAEERAAKALIRVGNVSASITDASLSATEKKGTRQHTLRADCKRPASSKHVVPRLPVASEKQASKVSDVFDRAKSAPSSKEEQALVSRYESLERAFNQSNTKAIKAASVFDKFVDIMEREASRAGHDDATRDRLKASSPEYQTLKNEMRHTEADSERARDAMEQAFDRLKAHWVQQGIEILPPAINWQCDRAPHLRD